MKYFLSICSALLLLACTIQAQQRGIQKEISQQPTSPASTQRVALVIGNSAYNVAPLKNPVNDAQDIAQALRDIGFDVIFKENLNQNDMKRTIRAFGEKLRGGVGLFYYAGHGVQVKGINYLVPVDAKLESEEEVEYECVDAGFVLAQMDSARNSLNIVILDACRNNPFARSFRSASRGLAVMDAPSGTLIAYATSPGSVASDGNTRNGLYTQEFLKFMRTPNLSIEEVFKQVRISVRNLTQGRQTPWEASSLTGDFYFSGNSTSAKNPPLNATDNSSAEEAIWDAIKDSKERRNFLEFIKTFPTSKYIPQAKSRLKELEEQPTEANASPTNVSTSQAPKSNKPIEIYNVQATKMPASFYSIAAIYVRGMSASADVKVFINDLDVSSRITQQGESWVYLQAKYEKFNLKPGKNEVYVIVDGVKSEPYVFKQFE
jgi:hypothetical protein